MKINKNVKEYIKNKVKGYLSTDQKFDVLERYTRLDLGENLIGHVNLKRTITSIKNSKLRYYADPSNSSIERVLLNHLGIEGNSVVIANSSDEIIDYLPQIFSERGDKNIVIIPSFYRFIDSNIKSGCKTTYVKLKRATNYKMDKDIEDQVICEAKKKKASIIWIANPNNPTGEVCGLNTIENVVKNTNALVVIDEAFFELYDPTNNKSAIKLISKYKNLIVLKTLSKAYGLAGLRFGYAVGSEEVIKVIKNYRNTLLMTSSLVIELAAAAVKDKTFIEMTARETKDARKKIFSKISKLKNLEIGSQSKTNIFLLRHKTKNLHSELLKHGVLVADFSNSKGIENLEFVRITIADKKKNAILLRALKKINNE